MINKEKFLELVENQKFAENELIKILEQNELHTKLDFNAYHKLYLDIYDILNKLRIGELK